jgi:hypothetical protein
MAIELGDLTVHSSLGQPLRASIAYALAPNEQLFSDCVSLRSGATSSGLPNVGRAAISVANGVIKLTGNTVVREPMVAAHLKVNCPYTANINREYMLFIDPQVPAYEATESVTIPVVAVAPAPARRVARASVEKNISPATPYQVQPGDSVSLIAQRIENRGIGLWAAVDAIFAANPKAFVDNDPNKLQAGVWLSIPNFGNNELALADTTPQASNVATPPAVANVAENIDTGTDITSDDVTVVVTTTDLKPGNVIVDDNPYVALPAASEVIVIPDTELAGPDTASTSPNVATAVVANNTVAGTTEPNSSSTPWWVWLAGGGIAIALALMLFGRRSRTQPFAAIAANANLGRRNTDTTDTEQLPVANVDFDLSDESPTAENQLLDADLILGTGLDNAARMDGSKLDIEFPLDSSHSILESEILPVDDDYDMSVIVDATEIHQPEAVTERDLKAVVVDADNETMITDSYTIKREVDFHILEQDYEDEMTATQALNEEITRAAAELASQVEDDEDAAPGDETAVLKLATVTELDVTSHLPIQQDTIGDDEDTGINEVLTENMPVEENTVAMPAAENDEKTVEMPIKSGKGG